MIIRSSSQRQAALLQRNSDPTTRPLRIIVYWRSAALHHPEHATTIQQVLAIPPKRCERTLVTFLTEPEIDALLAAPDRTNATTRSSSSPSRPDFGISELIALTNQDVHLGAAAHVGCRGKGRKQRITPLTHRTVAVLRTWLLECGGQPSDLLFPTRTGRPLSRDAVEHRLAIHANTATAVCPSLSTKKIAAHMLRHTAMQLLHSGVDTSVIALWLGHEKVDTTQIYLKADLALKERALARTRQPSTQPGRYRPPDTVLAYLESL